MVVVLALFVHSRHVHTHIRHGAEVQIVHVRLHLAIELHGEACLAAAAWAVDKDGVKGPREWLPDDADKPFVRKVKILGPDKRNLVPRNTVKQLLWERGVSLQPLQEHPPLSPSP